MRLLLSLLSAEEIPKVLVLLLQSLWRWADVSNFDILDPVCQNSAKEDRFIHIQMPCFI